MLVLRQNVVGKPVAPLVTLDRRRRLLSTVVKRHAPRARPFMVSVHRRGETWRPVDGAMRLKKDWSATLVAADDVVLITQLPLGGEGGGSAQTKQIGGAVALLALSIALPYAIPALAAGTALAGVFAAGSFATAAVSAGIVMGAGYLVSKFTQPKANTTDDPNRPLYGVSGGGNLPRKGDRIPVGYGRFWTQPDLSQPDYSVYDGEDQLLYKRLTLGLGKYQVHSIELGDATLWTEDDGVVAPFSGALGGDAVGEIGRGIGGGASSSGGGTQVEIIAPGSTSALVPGNVYSSPSVGGTELPRVSDNPAWAGPFRASPVGRQTSRIQLDWSAPQGVSHGDKAALFGVRWEYAPCDDDDNPTGGWQELYSFTVTVHTTRGARFSPMVDLPSGNYIVRGQNTVPFVEGFVNEATWDGLRSHYPETITRPHVTEIALKIRSGKSLGVTAFGALYVEATRILPVWNGITETWEDQPTQKAVYAFRDIMKADYGAGLADAQVDLERVKFYADELDEHDTFDGMIRGPVSVWEACAAVLGPMRAEPTRIANTWSINRDEPRTVKRHHVTRRQIVRNTTAAAFKIARDDGAADVIAEYAPDGDPRRRREVRVTFGSQSLTPSRVQLAGVSSHEHAHHLATWKAAAAYMRRERRKITLDRRGRLIQRGDPARIDAWFMAASETRAAGLLSRSGLTFALDTDVSPGAATYAMLRDRQNREWGPVKVTAGAKPNVIVLDPDDVAAIEDDLETTLSDALTADGQEMTSLLIGPLTEFADSFLIDSVQPQGRDRVMIEAVFDHPGVWDALGEAPPPPPPIPSVGDIKEDAVAVLPWVKARCVQKGVALVMEWAVGRARGAATVVVQISYDDGAAWEIVSNDLSTSGSYPLRHVEGAAVRVGAYAVNRFGVPGPAVYFEFTTFKPEVNSDTADIFIDAAAIAAELRRSIALIWNRVDGFEDYVGTLTGRLAAVADANHFNLARAAADFRNEAVTSIASVQEDFFAFAGEGGSYASDKTEIIAAVNGSSATINGEATAVATLANGVAALWTWKVDVNGNFAKIMLGADEDESDIALLADNVIFASPGYPDLKFLFGTIDGGPGFGFQGGKVFLDGETYITKTAHLADAIITTAKIGNAQITNAKIGTAEVSDLKIAGASVTVANSATLATNVPGNNVSFVSVMSVALTFTNTVNGTPIPVFVGGKLDVHAGSATIIQWVVNLNGVLIFYDNWQSPGAGDLSNQIISAAGHLTGNGGTVTATVELFVLCLSTSFVIAGANLEAAGHKR